MTDWNKVWENLLKTAEELGVSKYTLGLAMYGKSNQNKLYRKNLRACRCMCEDVFKIIKAEIEKNNLLSTATPEVKKTATKALKAADKAIKDAGVDTIPVKETTEETIKAAVDELKAMRVQPLIEAAKEDVEAEPEPEVKITEIVEQVIEEPIKEVVKPAVETPKKRSLYEQYYAILPESIAPTSKTVDDEDGFTPEFKIEEEVSPLFERVDKQSFVLEDWFYRMQYPFKILDGRKEVDSGDHILLYIKTNGEMKPYILSATQFKEFVSTGKVNYWFSCRVPKADWERTKDVD